MSHLRSLASLQCCSLHGRKCCRLQCLVLQATKYIKADYMHFRKGCPKVFGVTFVHKILFLCREVSSHFSPSPAFFVSLFFPYIFPSSHWVLSLQQESSGIVFVCRGKDCVKESFSVCLWSWLHMLTKKAKNKSGMTCQCPPMMMCCMASAIYCFRTGV